MALTRRERDALDLEREWWLSSPTKSQAIRQCLGCSPAAHYSMLRRLVSSREAFDYDPLVVTRLRRRMDRHRRRRLGGSDVVQPRS
ncbi:MAG: DUF3263 domain-containing protein [Acidimicrobiales bacterium]